MDEAGLILVPSPREVRRGEGTWSPPVGLADAVRRACLGPIAADGSLATPNPHIGISIDPGAAGGRPGGFRLVIGPGSGSVSVAAPDSAGVRHALVVLSQVLCRFPARVPAVVIVDWPAFATRGVMLDVSRNKIPTLPSLKETVDALAMLRFNHLQLYTEHTFAYAGHDEAWAGCDPITPAEARELDAYCRDRGIDLAPNQNCFGHLSSWLRLPAYAHLAETHGAWKFLEWDRHGPFSLCPVDPASEAFVGDLLNQLVPCFQSGLVNIGCDETFDVGFGRSAAEVSARGRPAVYFEFVGKVAAIVRSLGRRPMLWADIALEHPESLGIFPPGAIGLAWGYEPDAPFATWCERLRERGIEAWVCPGTSSWRSITGRTTERNANLAAAALQGLAGGATGYLVTDWGDIGHHQQWPIALAGIARAAQAAWNPDALAAFDARAVSLHVFGDRAWESGQSSIGPWLDELGDVDLPLRRAQSLRNASAMFCDLIRASGVRAIDATADRWREVGDRIEALAARRPRAEDVGRRVADELGHTLEVARLAVRHAVAVRAPGGPIAADAAEIASEVHRLLREHRRLWLGRNREGELAASCAHYERVIARLAAAGDSARVTPGGRA
ncbi:MAG: family 20 glycosylhydrolase [Phycisphaeraceae bacterium]|nr:family 20 glycosylhydrolase [Phycisphaeraceae bacterium]